MQVFVPGLFVALVTWLGARFAVSGRIDVGELVAFYGYAAFLVIPLRTAAEAVDKITRAFVGARRMLDVLAVGAARRRSRVPRRRRRRACRWWTSGRARGRPGSSPASSLPGRTSRRRSRDRLGRFGSGDGVLLGQTPLEDLCLRDVRRRIVAARQILGPVRRNFALELDPWTRATDDEILQAISVANAEDILEALPEGLDAHVDERGRSFPAAAPAARPGPRTARRPRGARPRRADERRRRPHRGEDRAPAP